MLTTPEPYTTADHVAEYLSLTRRQVLEMTRRGTIPGHPLGTGTNRRVWRYKLSEVDRELTAAGRKKSTEPALTTASTQIRSPRQSPVARRENSNG
jgi:excisionase family DNA binding protein